MNKKTLTLLTLIILTLSIATPMVSAKKDDKPGKHLGQEKSGKAVGGGKENSPVEHLYLYEKDPEWGIVEDGAWGKVTILTHKDKFVFNGHGLDGTLDLDYSLIYYPDPWPGEELLVLGDGTVNEGGNVHMQGEFVFDLIPIEKDENDGAKIWLVLSEDVATTDPDPGPVYNYMDGWNPESYLFENNLINQE
jgi:hypothetical protein